MIHLKGSGEVRYDRILPKVEAQIHMMAYGNEAFKLVLDFWNELNYCL
jgi:hypothetical protein